MKTAVELVPTNPTQRCVLLVSGLSYDVLCYNYHYLYTCVGIHPEQVEPAGGTGSLILQLKSSLLIRIVSAGASSRHTPPLVLTQVTQQGHKG